MCISHNHTSLCIAQVLYAKGLNPADHMTTKELGLDGVLEAPKEYEQTLDDLNVEELDELDEEDEYADSRVLDEYRQRRLQEFQQAQRSNRFGEIFEIVKVSRLCHMCALPFVLMTGGSASAGGLAARS